MAAVAAEGSVKAKSPVKLISEKVRYLPPKDWKVVEYANSEGADPVVREHLLELRDRAVRGYCHERPRHYVCHCLNRHRAELLQEHFAVCIASGPDARRGVELYRRQHT